MANLDAKPCVADLDARPFCRGYSNPLAMMGVALNRYLPGRNAMLVNESMYRRIINQTKTGLQFLCFSIIELATVFIF